MTGKSLCWLALLATAPAWAESAAHCPSADAIRVLGSFYSAPVGGGGEWLGIASAGASGRVARFDSAVLYPAQGTNPARFGKCSYQLQTGLVDLRFNPRNSEPSVRVVDTTVWKRQEGPFGLIYHECRQTDPTQCAFLYRD